MNIFNFRSIKSKIWLCVAVAFLGYLVSTVLTSQSNNSLTMSLSMLGDSLFPLSRTATSTVTLFENQTKLYSDAYLMGEEDSVTKGNELGFSIQENIKLILDSVEKNKELAVSLIDVHLNQLSDSYSDYLNLASSVYLKAVQGEEDFQKLGDAGKKQQEILENLKLLDSKLVELVGRKLDDGKRTAIYNTWFIIVLFVVVLVLSAIIIKIVSQTLIVKPIKNILGMVKDLARGEADLTRRLTVQTQDEVGEISNEFNIFLEEEHHRIRVIIETIKKLKIQSSSLSSSMTEVAAKANSIMNTSGETHQAIETTSSAITEMAASLNQLSENIKTMSNYFEDITQSTNSGAEAVSDSVKSMGMIKESSEKIGSIISVITEIAGQTNLLSLNAAIEAAKAGEHGKGFAVVAEEVRKLAERSATAAKEIGELITTSSKLVNNGTEVIAEAGTSLETILQHVGDTSSLVLEVNSSADEQSNVVEEIVSSTDIVAELSNMNAQAAREINDEVENANRATSELDHFTEEIWELLDKFKV